MHMVRVQPEHLFERCRATEPPTFERLHGGSLPSRTVTPGFTAILDNAQETVPNGSGNTPPLQTFVGQRQQVTQQQFIPGNFPEARPIEGGIYPRRAPESKLAAAAANDIFDQTGRSSAASIFIEP